MSESALLPGAAGNKWNALVMRSISAKLGYGLLSYGKKIFVEKYFNTASTIRRPGSHGITKGGMRASSLSSGTIPERSCSKANKQVFSCYNVLCLPLKNHVKFL